MANLSAATADELIIWGGAQLLGMPSYANIRRTRCARAPKQKFAFDQNPHLKLRAGYEAGRPVGRHLPGLPPVVVVLADDLQHVADAELDAGLGAGDQVVVEGVVVELGLDEDVAGGRGRAVRRHDLFSLLQDQHSCILWIIFFLNIFI